ncbi:MAG: AMP-binding protein, partial [Actinobacteria bacterium]|nr:AMP-binding protein [Actinomycetota bacterium]
MNTDYYSSVVDIVRARRSSDRPAIVDGEHRLTYADLDTSSNRVAQMLLSLGIGSGDRVGFLGRNCAEFFELLFGAAKMGAVVCAVNWRLSAEEVAYVLGDSGAGTVIAHTEFLHMVPTTLRIVVLDGDSNDSYTARRDAAPNLDPNGTPAPDDTWLQLYSSGTTG